MAVSIRSSKDEALEAEEKDEARWKVYSDGSGIDGKIGASAVLYRDGQEIRVSRLQLGADTDHTVYEAEGIGISLGLGLLWAERCVEGDVTIAVDSQPAIKATTNRRPTPSHYIWDDIHVHAAAVRRKHPEARITIRWTPGHRDVLGNERADEEAKKAAQEGSSRPGAIPPIYRNRVLPVSRSARKQ
ncbi:ribonuclease H-like domain-containing protein [Mycena pura]|uniref:Ribonuclease H-like domain-containing protein n=1 Tax=Mycena pura TaxID=153505 RepID=A0AAD6USU8_9AGAR|nr:ribonuclease H-like domain-containing protein [Mycena pura]